MYEAIIDSERTGTSIGPGIRVVTTLGGIPPFRVPILFFPMMTL